MATAAVTVPAYPQFEKIFEDGRTEPFLRLVERTRMHLQQIQAARTSSKEEKQRASAAYEAYTKALQLLKEVDDERRRIAFAATIEPDQATSARGTR